MLDMKLDHIGIAVRSLDQALKFYRDTLGMNVKGFEMLPAEKVRVAILPLGDTRLELLEATAEDSPIAQFLAKRGEGIHHIAIEVEHLDRHLQQLEANGVRVLPGKGQRGAGGHRYAFLHPSSCGGVLVELIEATKVKEAKEA
ncbi:methylmalonyl-CoA epimerase [Acidobacteriia bacterium AH_259_A11_L15]|nr:methylmalonyl-CoA epimerase [Acidobacteriia bacterium AH_259_A11_L15]